MKITVLDSISTVRACPGFPMLDALGSVHGFESSTLPQILERCAHSTVVLTGTTPIRREVMDYVPNIAFIGVFSQETGLVEADIAEALGIRCVLPGFGDPCRNLGRLVDEIARFLGSRDG